MKRLLIRVLVVCVFLAVLCAAVAQAVRAMVRHQLEQVFVKSRVSVGDCRIAPGPGISLSDVRIQRPGYYEVAVKEAVLRYPRDLLLKDVNVALIAPGKKIQEYPGLLRLAPQRPGLFRMVEVAGLRAEVKTLDCIVEASFSLRLNALIQLLERLEGKIEVFSFSGLGIEGADFKPSGTSAAIDFSVRQLNYDKLKATQVKGVIALSARECVFQAVSARMLGGDVGVDAKAEFGKGLQYFAALRCSGLGIEQLVDDFKLKDKFTMTGKLGGSLEIKGTLDKVEVLAGAFSTSEPGGTLVITDMKFLENMAASTRQPVDLLVESFKNYRYNTGKMTAGVKDGNVILEAVLEGQAGKRNLEVVLHGLPIRRQEK